MADIEMFDAAEETCGGRGCYTVFEDPSIGEFFLVVVLMVGVGGLHATQHELWRWDDVDGCWMPCERIVPGATD